VFERAKTVYALDRAAPVIGLLITVGEYELSWSFWEVNQLQFYLHLSESLSKQLSGFEN
jgi:hypothetical protein